MRAIGRNADDRRQGLGVPPAPTGVLCTCGFLGAAPLFAARQRCGEDAKAPPAGVRAERRAGATRGLVAAGCTRPTSAAKTRLFNRFVGRLATRRTACSGKRFPLLDMQPGRWQEKFEKNAKGLSGHDDKPSESSLGHPGRLPRPGVAQAHTTRFSSWLLPSIPTLHRSTPRKT